MDNIAQTAIIDPMVNLGNSVIPYALGVIAALITIILGYIIGAVVGLALKKLLEKSKLQKWLEKTGRDNSLGGIDAPKMIGALVKWWIFIAFLSPAVSFIKLSALSDMLANVAQWAPHLLAGIVIMIVGAIVADWAVDKISQAKKMQGVKAIAAIVRTVIIIFFLSISLKEIGIQVTLAETSFLIVLAGVTLALALAIGIGFGFAMREHANKLLTSFFKKL